MESEEKQPKYLYHKQKQESEPSLPKAPVAEPKKPRSTGQRTVGHRYFLVNLRTFLVVLLVMAMLLTLAWFVTIQADRAKQRKYAKQVEALALKRKEAEKLKVKKPTDVFTPGTATEETPQAVGGVRDIDTEAIRKAVYRAKRARVQRANGNTQEAIAMFKEALDIWPHLGGVWAELGELYLDMEDYPKAQIALERAVSANPSDAEILTNLALALLHQKYIPRAQELLEAAREIDGSVDKIYFYLGLCHIAMREYEQADPYLEQYLKLRPDDARALKEKAYLEARLKNYAGSLSYLKKALAESPEWGELYFDAAAASALIGRFEDAIRYLEKGEAFSTPDVAYKKYLEPAFQDIRVSELGRLYEQELAERVRRNLKG